MDGRRGRQVGVTLIALERVATLSLAPGVGWPALDDRLREAGRRVLEHRALTEKPVDPLPQCPACAGIGVTPAGQN